MSKGKVESRRSRRHPAARKDRCVIVNPKAGAAKDLDDIRKRLARLEPGKIYMTTKGGGADSCARQAIRDGYNEIVVAGGDGTLNEVINGISRRMDTVRVGLIPLGTGNDFARCLNFPAGIEDNIDIVLRGKTLLVDVVRAKSRRIRHFINVSTGGFSGIVDEKMTREIKRAWGSLAYLRGAAAALPHLKSYKTSIVLDDKERLSLDLFNMVVANGRFVAGGLPIAPEADVTDGKLDVVLIPKQPAAETILLAAEIVLGKHLSSNMIIARRATKVSVKSRPGMWFNVDGELIGNAPATFQVLPRALSFLAVNE